MSVQLNNVQTKTFEWAGLACVYIPTRDVVKAAEWYERVLGVKVRLVEPGSHAMLNMPGMGMFLVQTEMETTVNYCKTEGGEPQAAWCFSVQGIEQLHNRMTANGVRVTELRERGGCGINFQFYDPDGNYFDVNDDHRIFVPLAKVDDEAALLSLLQRKLGSKEPLEDWNDVSGALAACGKLPERIFLEGWEDFQAGQPQLAASLMQRLEKHNADFPEKQAEVKTG